MKFHCEELLEGCGGWTGHPDLMVDIDGKRWLLIDHKTGWSEQDAPSHNAQLRIYVALMAVKYGCKEITAYIVSHKRLAPCTFNEHDIKAAIQFASDVAEIVRKSANDIGTSGAWCRYCKANGNPERCPVSCAVLRHAAELPSKGQIALMTAAELRPALELVQQAETLCKAVRARAEEILAHNPDAFDGVARLRVGAVRREISDPRKVYFDRDVITEDEYWAAISMSRKALVDSVKASRGVERHEAESLVDAALDGLVEMKQNKASLEWCK